MKPRFVRQLEVNDESKVFGRLLFERVSDKPIRGLVASESFWSNQISPSRPPEIVVVDVNFPYDGTSPFAQGTNRPTGLLHSLPFVTWARLSQRPCVIVFHTGDKGLFSDATRTEHDPFMSALAKELGVLASAIHRGGESPFVVRSNIKSWRRLVCRIVKCIVACEEDPETTGVERVVDNQLSTRLKKILKKAKARGERIDLPTQELVLENLNSIIRGPSLALSTDVLGEVAEVILEDKRLSRKDRSQLDLQRENRAFIDGLLGDAILPAYQPCGAVSERAFEWFESFSNDEADALDEAVAMFRERIRASSRPDAIAAADCLVIHPSTATQLERFCVEIAGLPAEEFVDSDRAGVGLEVIFKDGSRDSYSFPSLFSDRLHFKESLQVCDFIQCEGCPPPCVTEFVNDVMDWEKVYSRASTAAKSLPCGDQCSDEDVIGGITQTETAYKVTRAVLVFFQLINQYQAASRWWKSGYRSRPWNPNRRKFGGAVEGEDDGQLTNTLPVYLQETHNFVQTHAQDDGWAAYMDLRDESWDDDLLKEMAVVQVTGDCIISVERMLRELRDAIAVPQLARGKQTPFGHGTRLSDVAGTVDDAKSSRRRFVDALVRCLQKDGIAVEKWLDMVSQKDSEELQKDEIASLLDRVISDSNIYDKEMFPNLSRTDHDIGCRIAARDQERLEPELVRNFNYQLLSTAFIGVVASDVPSPLQFHLNLLQSLGLAECSRRGTSTMWRAIPLVDSFPEEPPEIPFRLLPRWVRYIPGETSAGLVKYLVDTLHAGDAVKVRRSLAAIRDSDDPTDGTAVLRELVVAGACPGWLQELGREYARNTIKWRDQSEWPIFLR